jgi:hypothetical protein
VTGATITATDAGADVTITISAHTRHYPQPDGSTVDVAVSGGSLTGRAYSTTYYIYYDDPSRAGGAVTYQSTTSEATAAQIGDRHTVGGVTTPAALGAPKTGGYTRPPGPGQVGRHPMIERTFDAAFFNRICNLPEVVRGLAARASSTSARSQTSETTLCGRSTADLYSCPHGAGFYSVHTQFAAEGRGQHASQQCRAGWISCSPGRTACGYSATALTTIPARWQLALKGGAKPWFRKEHDEVRTRNGRRWDIMDWATSTPELEADGKQFHDLLEAAKIQEGSDLPGPRRRTFP